MITRREVFGLGALGAAALAAPSLWAGKDEAANGDPPVVPCEFTEAVFSKMKLRKATIKIGLPKPVRIVQASDSHLTFVSAEDFEKLDAQTLEWYDSRSKIFRDGVPGLAAALLYAKKKNLTFFHTGDMFDFPSRANFAIVKRDFEGRDWFFAPGNHEYHGWGPGTPAIVHGNSEADRTAARRAYEAIFPNKFPVASRVIGGVNFVEYDNGGCSDYTGCWQLAEIKREFAKGLPVVLLCHMPFYTDHLCAALLKDHGLTKEKLNDGYLQGVPWANSWGGRKELLAYLKTQPLLKAILCGHLHFGYVGPFSATAEQHVADANYKGAVYEYTFE